MNILVVDDEWPSPYSGKALRIINIFKHLAEYTNVHFLYFGNQPVPKSCLLPPNFVKVESVNVEGGSSNLGRLINLFTLMPGDYARWRYKNDYARLSLFLNNYIEKNRIDLIQVFSYFGAQYAAEVKIPKIWDVGDSLFLKLKRYNNVKNSGSAFRSFLYNAKILNYERNLIRKFDKTIFVSPVDANIHTPIRKKIDIIPNGVNSLYFESMNSEEERFSIVFTGHMNFEPNITAAKYFVAEILPLIKKRISEVKFFIVGADPVPEITTLSKNKDIVVTGAVTDLRKYIAKSAVFVSPMLSGSGIKNKILQAMAMGKAIVSTKLGVESLDGIKNGENIVVADNPLEFSSAVCELIENEDKRNHLGVNAKKLVVDKYGWELIVNKYRTIYEQILNN